VTKGRLEAFSDGVIAVAITLLVLNIMVPPPRAPGTLAHKLLAQWPSYAAYGTSFVTIGIIWTNHHVMISRLRQPDRAILLLNLALLLWIGVLPFATNVLATYLKQGQGEHLAAAVYSGSFLLMALTFATLNHHILFTKTHLLVTPIAEQRRRQILAFSVAGVAPYAAATALAVVSPYVTLAICAGIAVFYATPLGSGGSEPSS